ncbi:AAA family ATPase [Paenibacillus rhizovicinus]|uniref:AAA family ATPase n=1 Tax=Paenibacillus rhizovicinus TaxID=2704463 RepID=A0A6C0P756_9BACL|nr:AAA family ATPase [Paenibacillus rhizovicinus]QHW34450.1 AAA family ATPase [Paenibacillus rhizovicinus]
MSGTRAGTGLTLGKFAPLHLGHQSMIEAAIRENDKVIVIIYDCPETTDIPLNVRAAWIRTLYPSPNVQVIEAWDGPAAAGDTPEIKQLQERYILGKLNGKKIDRFYSSEFYGEHMSIALGAENRQVDPGRKRIPVSGTQVRLAPYDNRAFLSPVVYRDHVVKAVFLGAPSTGKSTLAAHLSERLRTVWMPEYGREYWEMHQIERRLTLEQLEAIAVGHIEREERLALDAREVLFIDTNAITTYMFSHDYHGEATPELTRLAENASSRYDLVFLCDDDIPYDDTWDRSGEVHRQVFQKQIAADLQTRRIPYMLLRGTLEERAAQVEAVLRRFRKYRSPYEWLR